MKRNTLFGISRHTLLILLALFSIFPIFWMVSSSLKPEAEILGHALFPANPTINNYTYALNAVPIIRLTLNTLLIATLVTALQIVTAILAAYALTRWEFKGRNLLYVLFSLTWLIPFQAIMIPNYITIANLGLRNTILGVVLPFAASSFAILSVYSAFKAFPKALVEAALLDNLSELSILVRIILPNVKATTVSICILLFINGWNEYIWAFLVNPKLDWAPIQIGLQQFLSLEGNAWGPLMAAATISSLPIILLYLFLQKQIINSFVKWGIK